MIEVVAEGFQIRDFLLVGNGDSVTQDDRAPLIILRRGRFVIENGETNNSSKDGFMITPVPEYGDIEHGVVRNLTGRKHDPRHRLDQRRWRARVVRPPSGRREHSRLRLTAPRPSRGFRRLGVHHGP